MWFGQHIYRINGQPCPGRWLPFETRQQAVAAGCDRVSVLELACSVNAYLQWMAHIRQAGRDPHAVRLRTPFRGPFYADFDNAGDLTGLKSVLCHQLHRLLDHNLLKSRDFQLWFSGGKGFHLLLDPILFGASGFAHPHLPTLYRSFAYHLGFGEIMDPSVYSESRGRLWRVAGKPRSNGCRKIPLTLPELDQLTMDRIRHLSQGPFKPISFPIPEPNPALTSLFWETVAEVSIRESLPRKSPRFHASREHTPSLDATLPPSEHARIYGALGALPSDRYDMWLTVGMALHQATRGSTQGLTLWHDWSRQSTKFDPAVLAKKWASFRHDIEGGITIATLFHLAKQNQKHP